jgi:hypothetical protein
LNKFVGGLVSPLMLVLLGGLLALLLLWRGWRRAGTVLALLCLGGLWLASTPWLAWTLAMSLETRYPPVPAQASPVADAVLVLGGALAAPRPPAQPHIGLWRGGRPCVARGRALPRRQGALGAAFWRPPATR